MLRKLGLSLGLPASVLSLTTWADAEDFKQLYRNEFAQIGQQLIGDVVIPEFDEDGNPIPPANELYPVCFNDFQAYINQIESIIAQVEDLDQNVIPANAAALWDVREVPNDESRDLQNLADEYTAAQAAGLWPQVQRVPVEYIEISNPHCDYLPEFIQMKDFIANRNIELEDKADFSSWLAIQTLIPLDPCVEVRDAFTNAANSLQGEITTQEQEKASLVQQLYEEFGLEEQTIEEFQVNLEEQFEAARDAGLLTIMNPLKDDKPDELEECKADTDPLSSDIDTFAAQLKDLEDFNDFPVEFFCTSVNEELQVLMGAALMTEDDAQLAISSDLADLLSIEQASDPELTSEALREQIEMDFAEAEMECDSEIQIPFDTLQPSCEDSLSPLFSELTEVRQRANESVCLQEFVRQRRDAACTMQHQERLNDLDSAIAQKSSEQQALVAQLFFDFDLANQGQTMDVFSDDQEEAFAEAVENGDFVGQAQLQDEKPTVPVDCEDDVASLNDEIDEKAALLKRLDDLIEFLPNKLCQEYDDQIQAVLDANPDALSAPTERNEQLLSQMAVLFQTEDESEEDFRNRIFTDFVSEDYMVEPDFGMPTEVVPMICALRDPTKIEELQKLIEDTTTELSYEKYLQDRLAEVCGESGMEYVRIRDDLQEQLNVAMADKQAMYEDLYSQLAPEGTALDDYISGLETDFEMAKESLEDRSDVQVQLPESIESCDSVVMPIRDDIMSLIEQLNDKLDCLTYTRQTVCEDLQSQVQAILEENMTLLPDLQEKVDKLLDDLLIIEDAGDDRGVFDLQLQSEFDQAEDIPAATSPIVLPTDAVPETCSDTVTYDELMFLQNISERQLAYEQWLKDRLRMQCGESATQLDEILVDLQTQLMEAQDDKAECISQFYDLFGEEDQTAEEYQAAWEQAYDEALAAGEATQVEFDISLPDTADSCDSFVDEIESQIFATADGISRVQSCETYIIDQICSDLSDQVASTLLANAPESQETINRISSIIDDILLIEGLTEDDQVQLEMTLREEYDEDTEKEAILSGIMLPTAEVPTKCQETVDYTMLSELIAEQDDLLSFEKWLDERRQAFCSSSGIQQFNDAITQLDDAIQQAEFDHLDTLQVLWAARGGDLDAEEAEATEETDEEETAEKTQEATEEEAAEEEAAEEEAAEEEAAEEEAAEDEATEEETTEENMDSATTELAQQGSMSAVDDFGLTFTEFVEQSSMNFDEVADEYVSDFTCDLELPEAHESCKMLTDPLLEEINRKCDQLKRLRDSTEFTCGEVCGDFQMQADEIVAANAPNLEALAMDVVEELRGLEPVAALEGESTNDLAERLHGLYVEGVEQGSFEPVFPDFTTPTEVLPVICQDKTDYTALQNLIAETVDALSFKKWLQELMEAITRQAVADHQAELERLTTLSEEEEDKRDELVQDLFDQFQIDDQTLEQFETYLENEFNELQNADMLPNPPTEVETANIPIPPGREDLVEELREEIAEEADQVGEQIDFNNFAFQFVCDEICQDIEAVQAQVQEVWDEKEDELTGVIQQLFQLYAEDGDTNLVFETRLRDEYIAQKPETTEQVTEFDGISLPIDEIPEGCATGSDKLDILKMALNDIQDLSDFLDYLMPRIDEAAMVLLQCQEDKATLDAIINDNFSVWSNCINKKSEVLTDMFNNPEFRMEGEEFLDFLNRIRAQYDELKDQELIFIIDPEITLPDVHESCPEEVHDQLWVADQFKEILEDSLSYKEWLKAIGGGYCDVEKFQGLEADLEPQITEAQETVDALLQNLFEIKGEDDEEEADYNARTRTDFDNDADKQVVSSDIEIPETSLSCGQDAKDAHQSLVDAVAGLDDSLTYIVWLRDLLEECCTEELRHYSGIKMLADLRHPPIVARKDALEHALWVFKGFDADEEAGTEAETLEEFTQRNLEEYRATDPLIIPIMSLGTFIDVPELCPESTHESAQDLLNIMAEINEMNAYNMWMTEKLRECSEIFEMNIDMMIEAAQPQVLMADQDKQEKLEDLYSFAAQEGESFDDFKDRIIGEFDRYLEETGAELSPTGIEIPDIPDLADDDTEEARQELIELNDGLAYCLTLVDWLEEEIFTPCDLLREAHENQLAEVNPMRDTSKTAQEELLESLKQLKPEGEGKSIEDFTTLMAMDFLEDPNVQQISSGIEQLETPLVCQEPTQEAARELAEAIEDLDNNLTFQNWLTEQNQECCWDLGLDFLNLRKEKEEERAEVEARNRILQDSLIIIDGGDLDDAAILAEFTEKSEAGEVETVADDTVVREVPEECQGSTHDARQRLLDECEELNIQETLEKYLEDELEEACREQADEIQRLIDEIGPEIDRINEEKARLFASWAEMIGAVGDAAEAFAVMQTLEFNRMFAAGELTPSSSDIVIPPLPGNCPEDTLDVLEDADALRLELIRLATLCDWIEDQIEKACEDQVEEINRLMSENMNRIEESNDRTEWIIMELYGLDQEGTTNLDRFKEVQGEAFVNAGVPFADTGVTLPIVAEECSEEAKDAQRGLERFLNNLGVALALEDWLQDKLQVFCDAIEEEILATTDEIQNQIDTECGPMTLELLMTLYDFEKSKGHAVDDFNDFSRDKRDSFERAAADLEVEVQQTGFNIPPMPDHCDSGSQEAREALINKELELEDCLTFNEWLKEQIQLTCSECAMRFMMEIDDQTIILQASQLRIVDQLDNLYLLEDPMVDGEPEDVVDYSTRKFREFEAADVEPMLPDFIIVDVAEDCHEDVKQLRRDLEDLKDDIGQAVAYEKWLKKMVKEALSDTEDEFRQMINDKQPDLEDAEGEVIETLEMLMGFKKREGETDEEFAARMKITFDRAFDRGLIEPEETGIVIPDLPANAPPSAVGARALLEKFDDSLSYQLTYAKWLELRLEDCCVDIIDEYAMLKEIFKPVKEAAIDSVASLLTDLFTFEGDSMNMDNQEFALVKREQFDMNQANPATAVDVIPSGMVLTTPPDICQQETFDALEECQKYSDALSDLLTYESWLRMELKRACDELKQQIDDLIQENSDILEQKQSVLEQALADLFLLDDNTAENQIQFARRLRGEFEEAEVELLDAGIVIPIVPEDCEEEVQDALAALELLKEQLDDCITFLDWLVNRIDELCDEKTNEFRDMVENPPHTQMPGMADPKGQTEELVDQLFQLQGESVGASSVEMFGTALRMTFDEARSNPDGGVEVVSTGITIDEIPDSCQSSTHLSREALVEFDEELEDTKTYNKWLRERLAEAQTMNEEECDELAAEYERIMQENFPRIQESKDNQKDIKEDAFILKAEEGESKDDFDARLKRQFLSYVPLPIDPEITYMEIPSTCQESTFEALEALRNFINSLSVEITYEDWLQNELKECCDEIIVEMNELADPARLTATREDKEGIYADLYMLEAQEGESLEDFEARVLELYGMTDVERVETGIVIPTIPESCDTANPNTQNTVNRLIAYDKDLGDCLTEISFLEALLAEACVEPRQEMEELLMTEEPRIAAAQAAQLEKLDDLYVFKGLHDESTEHFARRLRQVFDNYVTHRRKTGVVMPEFPEKCDDGTNMVASALNDLLRRIADEETYDSWLKANLDACCDDRFEGVSDLLEANMPVLQDLQDQRDDMMQFMWETKAEDGQTLDEFIAEKDAEYAELLANDEVDMAAPTNIHHLVPEVPDACDQEVIDAANSLRAVAEGIEDLRAQLAWLEPQAEECCMEIEPFLEEILLNKGPEVDFTQADIEQWLEDCFMLEGEADEDLTMFKARARTMFVELVNNNELELVDPMIDVPTIPEFCGEDLQMQYIEADVHRYTVAVFQTMGPWLQDRIDHKCEENAQSLDMIIAINNQARQEAQQDVAAELQAVFPILMNEGESLAAFVNRMTDDFDLLPKSAVTGLPQFPDSCDPEDSEKLPQAVDVIKMSLDAQDFAAFLSDQAQQECVSFEMANYAAQIDPDGLATRQAAKLQLLTTWHMVDTTGPDGESLDEFIARVDDMYAMASPEEVTSDDIVVVQYPQDCDEYSGSIEDTLGELLEYKSAIDECLTFEKWLADQIEAAMDDSECEMAIMTLSMQAIELSMQEAAAKALSDPKVNDFLDTMDTDNVMILSGDDYVAMTLIPQIADLVDQGLLEAATPVEPAVELDESCDQDALQAVRDAAADLAAQQTINNLIDDKVDEICMDSLNSLLSLIPQANEAASAKTVASQEQLQTNFQVAQEAQGYTGTIEEYLEAQYMAYQEDRAAGHFMQSERFPFPTMQIPVGFCSDETYEAVADYSTERTLWNDACGFAEWLRNDLRDTLEPIIEQGLQGLASMVDDQVNMINDAIDERIMEIFEEDQLTARRFADLEDARTQLLGEFQMALPDLTPEDTGLEATVPAGLAEELGTQADELNDRIDALEQQLTELKFLDEFDPQADFDECNLYKGVLMAVTSDLLEEAKHAQESLGPRYNEESKTNFFASGMFMPPTEEDVAIPTEDFPPRPTEDCDPTHEENDYEAAVVENSVAQQFAAWCEANQGDLSEGLCGMA